MKYKNLTLELRSYNNEIHTHQHDFHQLVLPVSGQLDIRIGTQKGDVSSETIAIIPAGQEHGFAAQNNNRFLVANVPYELIPELERLPAFISLDKALAQYVIFLHQKVLQGDANKNSERQMLLLLMQLLQERYGGSIHIDKRIDAVLSHIDQYFYQAISITQLAAIAHLSQRQLNELFKRQIGMTPQLR